MSEPKFQDRVRHKTSADIVTGTVIAKYTLNLLDCQVKTLKLKSNIIPVLDVRSDDDRIYWATPAENWEVIVAYEEGKTDEC